MTQTVPEQTTVLLKDIKVEPDRGRREFTGIMELAESLKQFGLIQPMVVTPREDDSKFKYTLVAGERRYRAAVVAGLERVPVTFRTDDLITLAEIELEENVRRDALSYAEEGAILRKIKRLREEAQQDSSIPKLSQVTGRSVGDISSKMKLSKKFEQRPDIAKRCKNLPYTAAMKLVDQIEQAEKVDRMRSQGLIKLTTELKHGDCRELIKDLPTDSVQLLVTDPPFGLEKLEKLRESPSGAMSGHGLMSATHNMEIASVLETLRDLAPELARVMKPGSHFYMFCGFQYAGVFLEAIHPHLQFQPPILIWDREKPSSPGYGYNYLSRAECILYGHTPPRDRRLKENKYNILTHKDVPRNLRCYPTEKPVPLLMELILNSSDTDETVLDPFAGSASTLIAARRTGRRAIGFEIDEQAFLRAQDRLQNENGRES